MSTEYLQHPKIERWLDDADSVLEANVQCIGQLTLNLFDAQVSYESCGEYLERE